MIYLNEIYFLDDIQMPKTAKLFWSGRSQAVRLPKEFRIEGDEVRIRKQGAAVILEPVASDWAWLDAISGEFSRDFFAEGRDQPELPSRTQLDDTFR